MWICSRLGDASGDRWSAMLTGVGISGLELTEGLRSCLQMCGGACSTGMPGKSVVDMVVYVGFSNSKVVSVLRGDPRKVGWPT